MSEILSDPQCENADGRADALSFGGGGPGMGLGGAGADDSVGDTECDRKAADDTHRVLHN